jgi:hypothetical protein
MIELQMVKIHNGLDYGTAVYWNMVEYWKRIIMSICLGKEPTKRNQ